MCAYKKEVDPEEQLRRKFKAKCRFRALGRLVMANTHWLIEDVDYYDGIDDVSRRIQQAVRTFTKKKQLLSVTDKALLNKPASDRTEHEMKYIYRIIGGLKCFKRYPNNVKKKLAALTYYKYYGPGRVIVRQHQEAHALYFIVSGDITVSQTIYDELLKQYISVDVGSMHAGDMFGEVSLLHNIPRTATCTTVGNCELLALMENDFKDVLHKSVQKQWDEVNKAMSTFTYFDALDQVARREGCIVAKMKSYEPNETILGDGVGVPNFVYFVLSGQCQMIENLQVIVQCQSRKVFYTLYDPDVPEEKSDVDFESKYFGVSTVMSGSTGKGYSEQGHQGCDLASKNVTKLESNKLVHNGSPKDKGYETNVNRNMESQSFKNIYHHHNAESHSKCPLRLSTFSQKSTRLPPKNLRTYFMQVCRFNVGSTFGFGENMRDRRIISLTPVTCMLLPKVWLLQRNTANIWTRIQYYLERKIPTKKQLFKEFVTERYWQDYRDQLVSDVISRSDTVNWTSVHDVPYSIRMEEMLDI